MFLRLSNVHALSCCFRLMRIQNARNVDSIEQTVFLPRRRFRAHLLPRLVNKYVILPICVHACVEYIYIWRHFSIANYVWIVMWNTASWIKTVYVCMLVCNFHPEISSSIYVYKCEKFGRRHLWIYNTNIHGFTKTGIECLSSANSVNIKSKPLFDYFGTNCSLVTDFSSFGLQ